MKLTPDNIFLKVLDDDYAVCMFDIEFELDGVGFCTESLEGFGLE